MGAALTYARRYALFTLVGIAGEDDLDAPDLNLKAGAPNEAGEFERRRRGAGGINASRSNAGAAGKGDLSISTGAASLSRQWTGCQRSQTPQGC